MNRQRQKPWAREWYSVSASALRLWTTLAVLLAVAGASWLVFEQWQRGDLQQRAVQTIDQASRLVDELKEREDYPVIRNENGLAWERLDAARDALVEGAYGDAYRNARQSLTVLKSILDIGDRLGGIRFLSVEGGVEYRRGERGAWKRAREQDDLDPGDWVKTSGDGTAELVFPDNTTYVLRPETMVHLGGSGQQAAAGPQGEGATDIVFGWVELTTAQRPSTVATPRSRAEVLSRSEALVSYDRDRDRARFAAFEGGVKVSADTGEQRTLGRLEQVEQEGESLGAAHGLPARPALIGPVDNHEVDLDSQDRLALDWQAVPGAARYWLRVSSGRLFTGTIVDDPRRRRTGATLGLRREGSFYWQVAAIGAGGEQGPWSEPRGFRVAALLSAGLTVDREPPMLEIRDMQPFGSLVIVRGRTEPGASVSVNGELAVVDASGSFNKAVQMTQEGWAQVVVLATDAAGNVNRHSGRVHIDVF